MARRKGMEIQMDDDVSQQSKSGRSQAAGGDVPRGMVCIKS